MNRRNAKERDIRTQNNHFFSGLSETEKLLPMKLWDRLLDQAYITLNMLRPSRLNPKISAHDLMEGNFELKKTLLAPPGTNIILHKNPTEGAHGDSTEYKAGT